MIKRGVIFFILNFIFSTSAFSSMETFVNYTVIPEAKGLSGTPKDSYLSKTLVGGFHNLIKELLKDTNISANFIGYDDYFSALENTTVYSSISTPEIMLGATFSEGYTNYLDYVSVPIFTDTLVLIVNKKSLPAKFNFTDDFNQDIKKLTHTFCGVKGINIPYFKNKRLEEYKTIESGFEEIFMNDKILLAPKTLVDTYMEKNSKATKLENLKVVNYKNFPIYLFFVINKKSSLFTTKFNENNFISDILFKRLQEMIDHDEIQKIIEQK